MSSSSSRTVCSRNRPKIVRNIHGQIQCNCPKTAIQKSSTTPLNKGRMFLGCPLWPDKDQCGFFVWLEDVNKIEEQEEIERDVVSIYRVRLQEERTKTKKMNNEIRKLIKICARRANIIIVLAFLLGASSLINLYLMAIVIPK